MANLLEDFKSAYNDKLKVLINETFLHQPLSPYLSEQSHDLVVEGTNLLELSSQINNKLITDTFISKLEKIEKVKALPIFEGLQEYYKEKDKVAKTELEKAKQGSHKTFFKALNKYYKLYSQEILSENKDYVNGYYQNKDFYNQPEILKAERDVFEKFANNFLKGYFDNIDDLTARLSEDKINNSGQSNLKSITTKVIKEGSLQKVKTVVNSLLETVEDIQQDLNKLTIPENKKGNSVLAESYNILLNNFKTNIEQWVLSRGLVYIQEYYKENKKIPTKEQQKITYNSLQKSLGTEFSTKIKNVQNVNLHKGVKEILGSFQGYTRSTNRMGFVAEKNFELLMDNLLSPITINFNQKHTVKVTGNNTNNRGKQGKSDIEIAMRYNVNSQESNNKSKDVKNINVNKIRFSLKNSAPNDRVKLHSSGKIDTIANFLEDNIKDVSNRKLAALKKFNNYICSKEFKYKLVNEGYEFKNGVGGNKFLSQLKKALQYFGPSFAFGNFLELNDINEDKIDKIDFFVLNNTIVPVSFILKELKTEEDKTSKISVQINFPSYPTDLHLPPLGENQPYSSAQALTKSGRKGKNLVNHTTFTISMYAQLKNAINRAYTEVTNG